MAIEAALVFLCLALPLHWLVLCELAKESDPRYLREHASASGRASCSSTRGSSTSPTREFGL